jgi:hypothetical protein
MTTAVEDESELKWTFFGALESAERVPGRDISDAALSAGLG